MKRLILVLFLSLSAANYFAQTETKYADFVQAKENERSTLWKEKSFDKALVVMKEVCKDYYTRDNFTRKMYGYIIKGLYYNIACAHSLLNQKDSAFVYLNKALAEGYSNYQNTLKDTDFDNIRGDSRFAPVIETLRERGDYKYLLKKYALYKTNETKIPEFTYLSKEDKPLTDLRKKYELDKIAGDGDEISRFINLMKWVHKIVKHDGNSNNPADKKADALITVCTTEKRGINCRMMATILNEVYLSMGYKSRFITCMPMGEIFDDCHVINEVYSTALNKWIWMDPTFETWITDDKGNYLSIQETRYRLVNGLTVIAPESMNWNGQPYGGGTEAYLHSYMSKNLYRFSIALNSCSALENLPKTKRIYVELYPVGYNPKNVEFGKLIDGAYYTTDESQYWKAPSGK